MKFENYLEKVFIKQHPEVLGDDFGDAFALWLELKDVDDIIQYGNEYADYLSEKEEKIV